MPPGRFIYLLALLLGACPAADGAADLSTPPDLAAPPSGDLGPAADLAVPLRPLRSQDVTIMYPLPPASDMTRMVWASTLGTSYGRLIPEELFRRIPGPLDPRAASRTQTTDTAAWYALRLTGVRLDPCFGSRGEVPDAECKNQIRLVFQGVHPAGEGSAGDDGAIHALYELPRAELLAVARELLALTEREGGYAPAPLGVHPILKRQGYGGAFAQGVKDLLRQHLGEQRLTRMTFFVRGDTLSATWRFGAFDRKGAVYERAQVATTTETEQSLLAGFPVGGELSASVTPGTQHDDNLLTLLSGAVARSVSEETRLRAFGAALRIESPLRHTPETIDCVSCHAAQAARAFGEQGFALASAGHPDLYAGPGDLRLEPRAQVSLENVHAMSYLDGDIGLSQRTVNESAAVAQQLTDLLKTPP